MTKALLLLAFFPFTLNAALIDRGNGLIYDADLNITWLADANYAMTSGYDSDGLMTWQQASDWAAQLTYLGVTGWRLPVSDYCAYACTDSEMGHLFYAELGGLTTFDISQTHNSSFDLFVNIPDQADYWSGTQNSTSPYLSAFGFDFDNGVQSTQGIVSPSGDIGYLYAWAVHDGDIAASIVPIPPSVLLFISGILGLLGITGVYKQSAPHVF